MPVMYVLVNPADGWVVESSLSPITAEYGMDYFITPHGIVYDPYPSSGAAVAMIDFPMESVMEYQMIGGVPVRMVPLPPPATLNRLQFKGALLAVAKLQDVDDWVASSATTDFQRLVYAEATDFARVSALVTGIKGVLGYTELEMDDLFYSGLLVVA